MISNVINNSNVCSTGRNRKAIFGYSDSDTRYSFSIKFVISHQVRPAPRYTHFTAFVQQHKKIGHIFNTNQILKRFSLASFCCQNQFPYLKDHYNYRPLLNKYLQVPQVYCRHTTPMFLHPSSCLLHRLEMAQMGTNWGWRNH